MGGGAKNAENYPAELIIEILRGIRDTADGLANTDDDENALCSVACCMHSGFDWVTPIEPKEQTLEQKKAAVHAVLGKEISVKWVNGKKENIKLGPAFKDMYRGEYTNDVLDNDLVRAAMSDELAYSSDRVWELTTEKKRLEQVQGLWSQVGGG